MVNSWNTETARDPWQVHPLPATLDAERSPLPSLSGGTKAVLNALRARPFGATAAKLAELAGVSYSHTLRCLAELERRAWAERSKSKVPVGYESRSVTLWGLSWTEGCMEALMFLRDRPTHGRADVTDRIPPRFWRCFWSGTSADKLRISRHGLHIAETLIGGRDPCARAWALGALPTGVLRQCRKLRGCDTGLRAEQLDAEISRRATRTGGVEPSRMRWIAPSTEVSGMRVGSLPDLMATKLDVIRHRAKLRDYLDLAALDRSGACSLEAGLSYYCRRFGYSHPPPLLEEITRLLDDPGVLSADPEYEDQRGDALMHLRSRVPDLRERVAELRDSATP